MLFRNLHIASTSGVTTAKGLLASSKHSGDLSPQRQNMPKTPSERPEHSTTFHAWLGCRGSPAPASDARTLIKLSSSGVGAKKKTALNRKAVSHFSRWEESGSVTHLPARACWGVSERNLITRRRVLPELSLGPPAAPEPHLFPPRTEAVGAGAMPARAARAHRSEASLPFFFFSWLSPHRRAVRASFQAVFSSKTNADQV